jgi:putative colanic acid biosynthesis UDP-glucose lipid carrier transferase
MKVSSTAHLQQATKNDSRLTRIGKFLRRTSLDEFPQFINVLRGDMSIIGPRPHMLKHTDQYSKLIGQYMVRQFLKPGITGWAQVNGYRGETRTVEQMQKRVEHDLWYLENWSLFLDLKIMAMTAFNTVKGDKNAF